LEKEKEKVGYFSQRTKVCKGKQGIFLRLREYSVARPGIFKIILLCCPCRTGKTQGEKCNTLGTS
jgi:hypothetical protein